MKKLLTILFSLLLLCCVSGCQQDTAESVMAKAQEKAKDLKSLTMTADLKVGYSGLSLDLDKLLFLKVEKTDNEIPNMQMNLKVDLFDAGIDLGIYVVDGVAYLSENGQLETQDLNGISLDLGETDYSMIFDYLKDATLEVKDGKKIITASLSLSDFKDVVPSELEDLKDSLGVGSVEEDFMTLVITLNKDYYVENVDTQMDLDIDGMALQCDLHLTLSDHNHTKVELPQ